ncbi:MAG: MgtC/SapB family protein [Candidatus Aenigmarchaeota archaeon]|nr:MgtC/SapB family protein [Candidatus Aenigmarchaeota archaeon]
MVLIEGGMVSKILIAAFLGGMLGLERQVRNKPADIRTSALVCMGAAFFGMLASLQDSSGAVLYPGVAGGIVTGLGFLGAGMIIRGREHITGLTTAAEVWVIGAIGLSIGLGMYEIAVGTALVVLLVQVAGKQLEKITLKRKK